MGIRSTFVVHEQGIKWPSWFIERWGGWCMFDMETGVVASRRSAKTRMTWPKFLEDMRSAVDWVTTKRVKMVFLHDTGGITLCTVTHDGVVLEEPTGWARVQEPEHHG